MSENYEKKEREKNISKGEKMFPAGLEPATFRVLGGRDNHYTTETTVIMESKNIDHLQTEHNRAV